MSKRTTSKERTVCRLAALAGALALGVGTVFAQTTYVSVLGDDDTGDGSYGNPWKTVAKAVADTADGGTVMVATGRYVVSTRIAMSKDLAVRSWNEGAGSGEDPGNTVIDGNEECSPLWLNHADARVSGFTITRGNGVRTDVNNGRGGAVYMNGGTLSNCVVISNTANQYGGGLYMTNAALAIDCTVQDNSTTSTATGYGGGIYLLNAGTAVIRSRIAGNVTRNAGGGANLGAGTMVSNCQIAANTVTLTGSGMGGGVNGGSGLVADCVVSNNQSALGGGGVAVQGNAFITVRDSTITHNRARLSGSGMTVYTSYIGRGALVTNCLIQYNSAYESGGYGSALSDGYQYSTAKLASSGTLTVANCRIVNNGGTACDRYGAIWIWTHGTALIHQCTIASNDTSGSSGGGGGFYIGTGSASVVVQNCLVSGNSATNTGNFGGGIAFGSASCAARGPNPLDARIESCTIVDNRAKASYGGMSVITNHTTVWNSVIVSNSADSYPDVRGGAAYIEPFHYSCSPELSNTEQGNVTAAPLFESYAGADYRLAAGSPGLDAGTNQAWMDEAVDLDGKPRIDRFRRRVDMGAYERMPQGMLLRLR